MKTSEKGKRIVKNFEGLRLKTYKCVAGVLTIGYGHTGNDVTPGLVITNEKAEQLLTEDLGRFERCVSKCIKAELSQNEFDALVSLAFNIGESAFTKSTLVVQLNSGVLSKEFVAKQFTRWCKVNGETNQVLLDRRNKEKALFLTH